LKIVKTVFFVLFLFLVLFLPSCTNNQKPDTKARVEIIDGVEYIHNTETPLYPEKSITFIEDLSIGGEKENKIILYKPWLGLVDDNEHIYIREIQDQVIKVFDAEGKHIKTIGAKGSGPGEFQMITNLAITKDEELVVMDQIARRTSFFNSSGLFIKSFQWQTLYFNFILIKNSSYIISETFRSSNIQSRFLNVKEIVFNGKEIRFYDGEFTRGESLIARKGNWTHFGSLPDPPRSLFAGEQERGLFYHCLNNKYMIEVYDDSGKIFRKIDRPYEPISFTDKDAEEYWASFDYDTFGVISNAAKEIEMPKVKSIATKMIVDDECNLWIRTNEIIKEEDKILTAYDIFDLDGYYIAKVWTALHPAIFKNGKMYRMDTDPETGYRIIKRYKVMWE
jgi:hypothetical protein